VAVRGWSSVGDVAGFRANSVGGRRRWWCADGARRRKWLVVGRGGRSGQRERAACEE
jgi:hypothetical protein